MRIRLPKLPKTLYGFPVEADGLSTAAAKDDTKKKGIALIIAIMIISVMMLFTTDLIISSQVNVSLAAAQRDTVKAEYLAKSGFNAALLLIAADFAYDLFNAQQNPKAAGLNDGLGDWWTAMNGLPIGGETLEMMGSFTEEFGLNKVLDSGVIDQLKLFDGSFTIDVSDESSKIDINDCVDGRCTETMMMLEALFSCPAEKAFLDAKKLEGKQLAYRIKDWASIKADASPESGFNDEDEPYARREPKLRSKDAPFDTIDELRLIEGWDEEVHAVFSPYLTIFPLQKKSGEKHKMNINTANRALLQCLFPEAKGDCNEKATIALRKRDTDKANLGDASKKVSDVLKETLCYTGGDGNPGEANNRANWFQQNSMVFRVDVRGSVNGTEKVLTSVVERVMPDPKKNEKQSYKVLYWKVI